MKKLKGILILVLLLALLASPIVVLASDISGAKYYGLITVSNNGTAAQNVATTCNISTANLISGGYLNSSANNCVIQSSAGADLPFMPSVNATYPWAIWVPSIGANSYLSDILYTANSAGGKIRYFPDDEGMTTTDSTSLELGDNFTIEQSGWVNTDNGSDKYLVYKPSDNVSAFRTHVSDTVSGNITSEIGTSGWITPSGDNDPSATWSDEAKARDGNTATYSQHNTVGAGGWTNYLELPHSAIIADGIQYWATDSAAANIDINMWSFYGGAWHDEFNAAATKGAWTTISFSDEFEVTNVRVRFKNNGPGVNDIRLNELEYSGVSYSVTATGVSSGEHTVKVTGDYALDFDGVDDLVSANTTIADIQNDATGSIEIWFKSDNLTGAHALFCASDAGDADSWVLIYTSGTNLYTGVLEGGANQFNKKLDGVTLVLDTWYHLVVVQDGVKAVGYVDGVKYDYAVGHPNYAAWFVTVGSIDDVALGARMHLAGRNMYFKGLIAEARIYDRALSEAEVGERFIGIYSNETGLTSRWYMDDGSGARVYDSSGNGYDATQYTTGWAKVLKIYVDDVLEDWDTGGTIPNNANNWTFLQNDAMPYMEYHTISVNSTQVQYIEWEYDDTTFEDQSAFDNDATPTFRTASSDVDVTAELISFLPISEAKAPAYVLEEAPAFIESVPTVVSEFGVTPPAGDFPLAGVITAVANATDTPAQLPLVLIAGFVIIGLSLAISGTMRKYGSGTVLVKVIVIAAMMGIFVALKNFGIDFWMVFVFLIIGIALAMASRQLGWQ